MKHYFLRRKKTMQRILSFLLTVCMMTGFIPAQCMQVAAAEEETRYTYSLKKLATNVYGVGTDITTVTSYTQTTIGHNDEINKEIGRKTDPWIWGGQGGKNPDFRFTDALYGCMFDGGVGDWAAIHIKVPHKSIYRLISLNAYWGYGATVRIYLAPRNVENPRDEQYALGNIDSYISTDPKWTAETDMGQQILDAGEYTVSYKLIGKNAASGGMRFAVGGFTLSDTQTLYFTSDAPTNYAKGYSTTVNLSATKGTDAVDYSNATVTATSQNSDIATVSVGSDNKTLSIKAIEVGQTMVQVNFKYLGITKTLSIPISVNEPRELFYNYRKLQKAGYGNGTDIKTVTSFTQTTIGHPDEINKEIKIPTSPWIWAGDGGAEPDFRFTDGLYGCMFDGAQNDWAAVKIRVPVKGKFYAISQSSYWRLGANVKVYLAPGNADNPRDEKYEIGIIDSYRDCDGDWVVDTPLKEVNLEADDYIVSYVIVGKNAASGGMRFPVGGFKLAILDAEELILDAQELAPVPKNYTRSTVMTARFGNNAVSFSEATELTAVSQNTNIATAQITKNGMNADLVVTGINKGEIKIKVKATIRGLTTEYDVPVKVFEPAVHNYNILKLKQNESDNIGLDIKTITSYSQTTVGHKDEINAQLGIPTSPWIWGGQGGTSPNFRFADANYGCLFDGNIGDYASIKISVPITGTYGIFSKNAVFPNGAIVKVYLAPDDATNPLAEEYSLGEIDTYRSTSETAVITDLKERKLNAGNYIVTYQMKGKNAASSGTSFGVSAFQLADLEGRLFVLSSSLNNAVNQGESNSIELTAKIGNEQISLENVPISAVSRNTSIATVIVAKEAGKTKLIVEGTGIGNSVIDVSVKLAGYYATLEVPIKVNESKFFFNYLKLHKESYNIGTDVTTVTSFTQTTMGHADEINKDRKVFTDPWIWVGQGENAFFRFTDNTYGCMFDGTTGSWASLKIRVKASGTYLAKSKSSFWYAGAIVKVYLSPDGAEDPMDERYVIGMIDSYRSTISWNEEVPLRNVKLTKGDYILSYKMIGKNAASTEMRFPVGGFKLDPKGPIGLYLTTENYDPVLLGNPTRLPLKADIEGEEVSLDKATVLTVTSKNPEIAVAEYRKGTGENSGLIVTGKKVGDTELLIHAEINGLSRDFTMFIKIVDANDIARVETKIENSSLQVGENTTVTAKGILYNGDIVPDSECIIYYDTSDANVALVDEKGNISAVGEGTAKITAYCKISGVIKTGIANVIVIGSAPIKSASITAPSGIPCGGSAKLQVTGLLENGSKAVISANQITYRIVSATPKDAISVSDTGTVAGVAVGTATIQATVTLGGVSVDTEPVTIAISKTTAQDVIFNFKQNQMGTPVTAKIETGGWKVNREKTGSTVLEDSNPFSYKESGIQVNVPSSNEPLKADVSFDVSIPYAGFYAFELNGGQYNDGGVAAVYIDNTYMGKYDFYGESVVNGKKVRMNSLQLSEGIHTVTLRRLGDNQRTYLYPDCMTFCSLDELPRFTEVEANVTKSLMSVGETARLTYASRMSNGDSYQFGSEFNGNEDPVNKTTIISSAPSIVSVNGDVIYAKAEGRANLTITARVGGVEKSRTLEVVVDGQKISQISAKLSEENLFVGSTADIILVAKTADGREIGQEDLSVSYTVDNAPIASISGNKLTVLAQGTTNVKITATLAGVSVNTSVPVTVGAPTFDKVSITADAYIMKPTAKGITLTVKGLDSKGGEVSLSNAKIVWDNKNPEVVKVSEDGFVTPVAVGDAVIGVNVTIGEIIRTGEVTITVSEGKTQSTYYTPEKVAAARENVQKYPWAKSVKDEAVKRAEKYLNLENFLWESVTTQGLPRCITVGYRFDPDAYKCRYCKADLLIKYGNYGWLIDPINTPWKIQCPECRRRFPSNDFGKFYEAGLDEHHNFNYEKAKQDGADYLKNVLYPEKGEGWGVDDGFGYRTGRMASDNKVEEVHTYIGYYNHWGVWHGASCLVTNALNALKDAYIFTGDARYGRVGAILIDRVADVYPDMKIAPYFPHFFNSDSSRPSGKTIGKIWEAGKAGMYAVNYDAFFPMMDDPSVINFLSQKAKTYQFANDKSTAKQIRKNCEDGILRQIYEGVKIADIQGNFGTHQSAVACAAVVLDTMPETAEMIDFLYQPGEDWGDVTTGGNILPQLINVVDSDGMGNEGSPGYNNGWISGLVGVADALGSYKNYEKGNLYNNPKFVKMLTGNLPLTLCRRATAQVGDTGRTASVGFDLTLSSIINGFYNTKKPVMAQAIYLLNGNKTDNLRYDIFTPNPESIQSDVKKVIDTVGEYDFDKSDILPGFGFSILRDGQYQPAVGIDASIDTQRDFWMSWGRGRSHNHPDALNLGIEAYGLNMAPDLGYPETMDGSDNNLNWGKTSINHNLVVVNETKQSAVDQASNPLHFDDSGRIKLMDVDAHKVYGATSIYRRTVVMVKVSDEVSYGVDFFRVKGGNDHLYSFHSQSDEIYETEGITLVPQKMGTYAGPTVPWGAPNSANGFAWFENVRRARAPRTGEFAVDFKVKDFRKILPKPLDLHLRMTMLNDFELSEVAISEGVPPRIGDNPKMLEFVFARRNGSNLDSLFTTVFEPYKDERYIEKMEQVPIARVGGAWEGENDKAKAVKVTLKNGCVDYVVYTTNNLVEYRIDNLFQFRGFVGVYTINKDGEMIYSYANDGDLIGDQKGVSAYTGIVKDFTKDLSFNNTITAEFDGNVDIKKLPGRYIYVTNDGVQNGAYKIVSATEGSGNTAVLGLGDVTLIRKFKDDLDLSKGYIYNVAEGARFRIPLSLVNDSSPIFKEIPKHRAEVGSEVRFMVNATSPIGRNLTYTAVKLPRGAQFDPKTCMFTWTPDKGLIGKNNAVFEVTDGYLTSTKLVEIEVFNDTRNSSAIKPPVDPPPIVQPPKTKKNFNVNESIPDGGKVITVDYLPENKDVDTRCVIVRDPDGAIVTNSNFDGKKIELKAVKNGKYTIEYNPKSFADMNRHEWAEDAVIKLAARGIINGTSETTFNPGANITRADFVTLVVRALGLTADKTESFTDVTEGAYYADAVSIAKRLGIVNGQGSNKFNPTAEITREDMMVIVMRALDVGKIILDASYNTGISDTESISNYAKDAVAKLTGSGLIKGDNGKVNPKGKTTRAEVAILLERILSIS